MRRLAMTPNLARPFGLPAPRPAPPLETPAAVLEKNIERPRHIEIQAAADRLRQRHPPWRARMLDPAPSPEGHRGVSGRLSMTLTCANGWGAAAISTPGSQLPERRDGRISRSTSRGTSIFSK
jgi:hypothetical protein